MPSLSVLITYHNEEGLLTRCLESFDHQPIDEIIIFDDASTKRPEPYIRKLSIPTRVVRSRENVGPAHGRNRLLREASSEYVHFHDSDDWVTPQWGERVQEVIQTGADAVFTEVSSFRNGQPVVELVQELRFMDTRDPVPYAITHFLLVPSGTYRKTVVERMGGYSDHWQSEDYYFHVKLLSTRPRVAVILEPLVGIDLRTTSRSTQTVEVWSCTLDVLRQLSEELEPRHQSALAEMAHHAGTVLFAAHSSDKAREAFSFSQALGGAKLVTRNWLYRGIAKVSPMMAERVGAFYRVCLPPALRERVKGK
ncbi:MAG: glycosyltransferase family 2 protein [Deltaproteobacteria bacterium]|nr:glycosyltransferase family 2 protein [Deltaproteobacteria bacterium]MBI3294277.1 glycosyltransferase family 2 protein [Deltaproteobacteria bacterium]